MDTIRLLSENALKAMAQAILVGVMCDKKFNNRKCFVLAGELAKFDRCSIQDGVEGWDIEVFNYQPELRPGKGRRVYYCERACFIVTELT